MHWKWKACKHSAVKRACPWPGFITSKQIAQMLYSDPQELERPKISRSSKDQTHFQNQNAKDEGTEAKRFNRSKKDANFLSLHGVAINAQKEEKKERKQKKKKKKMMKMKKNMMMKQFASVKKTQIFFLYMESPLTHRKKKRFKNGF
jgi:hypothetical protein